ncbi:dienelactone hydrolase family protein [Microbispora sp. CA-102843]|uniref:dienelactone hydrolase family protein n=1 Tax=Microbispora sp. CA-102843 TaxID=3239952 RepID=UPI003D900C2F
MAERTQTVTVADGGFDLRLWIPERGTGPGLLLIPEIWGVSDYIRAVAADLAGLGYVVGVPDLFWRLRPGWAAAHDEEGLRASLELSADLDTEKAADDCAAALTALAARPEVTGGTGALGFCLGGSLAYAVAARGDVPGLSAVLSFYGSAVPDAPQLLGDIRCPIQFHFGGRDPYITRDRVAVVEEAAAGRPNVEVHVQEEAGHAFHNFFAPMFHNPEAGRAAWALAMDFLRRHLPAA